MTLIERLTHVMVGSGSAWVLWLLFALSFGSVTLTIDRALALRKTRGQLDTLVPELRRLLRMDDRDGAERLLAGSASVEARVVGAGLSEADAGAEAAEEAMAAASGLERKRLERGLLFLGTVGNNAPFVGLLGTVLGIIRAFHSLDQSQGKVTAGLMMDIGEALVATAIGIMVAIPAVAAFNYGQRVIKTRVSRGLALSTDVTSYLLSTRHQDQSAAAE